MNILYHHRTLGDGAEGIHITEMVKAFRQLGHKVVVAGPVGELKQTLKEQKGLLSKIKNVLPGFVFELLEMGYSLYCCFDLLLKAKSIHADMIYDRYITFNAGSLWAARLCKIPLVLEVNAPLALERSKELDERLYFKSIAHAVERYVCTHADLTIVVSTPLKDYLESVGVPEGKCLVMPNGVDEVKFKPQPKDTELMKSLGIASNALVIGFTGILRPWHGVEMLVNATQMLKNAGTPVNLLIVGDGPIKQELEEAIHDAGLEAQAVITGRVPHEEICRYVALFDIAVSPKATFYASPMKIIEYMAQGKAVVAPNMPNICDIICSGETGLLFAPEDGASLAETLLKLDGNSKLKNMLGTNARTVVTDRLNWQANARNVIEQVKNTI